MLGAGEVERCRIERLAATGLRESLLQCLETGQVAHAYEAEVNVALCKSALVEIHTRGAA